MFDFAKAEEEYIDGDEAVGLGTLGSKEGSGQLRVVANQQKLRLNAKQQKKYKGRLGGLASTGGLAAVNGLSSSLAFTPVQVRLGFFLGGGRWGWKGLQVHVRWWRRGHREAQPSRRPAPAVAAPRVHLHKHRASS